MLLSGYLNIIDLLKFRQLIAAYPESIANPSLLKQVSTNEAAQELKEKIDEAYPIVNAYCGR